MVSPNCHACKRTPAYNSCIGCDQPVCGNSKCSKLRYYDPFSDYQHQDYPMVLCHKCDKKLLRLESSINEVHARYEKEIMDLEILWKECCKNH